MLSVLQAVHPVLASHDVMASIRFFGRMGFEESFRDAPVEPEYAAVRRDGVELHIQWAAPDQWANGIDRPVYRIPVTDVDALFEELLAAGDVIAASIHGSPWKEPADTPWGTREFHIHDPGKHGLQFYRPLLETTSSAT